jgi:hypothetical protein
MIINLISTHELIQFEDTPIFGEYSNKYEMCILLSIGLNMEYENSNI